MVHSYTLSFLDKISSLFVGLLILLTSMVGCVNNSIDKDVLVIDEEVSKYFSEVGMLHNTLLDENKDFLIELSSEKGEKIHFGNISKDEAYSYSFQNMESNMLNSHDFNEADLFVNSKEVAFNSFYEIAKYKMNSNKLKTFQDDFSGIINELEFSGELPSYSSEVFDKLSHLVINNGSGLEEALESYLAEEIEKGSSAEKIYYIKLCNEITKNSTEFWASELKKNKQYSAQAIPAWAIADIAGAVIGGGSAIIMQWEDINWWKVGANALWIGAGSSGLRWLLS